MGRIGTDQTRRKEILHDCGVGVFVLIGREKTDMTVVLHGCLVMLTEE